MTSPQKEILCLEIKCGLDVQITLVLLWMVPFKITSIACTAMHMEEIFLTAEGSVFALETVSSEM